MTVAVLTLKPADKVRLREAAGKLGTDVELLAEDLIEQKLREQAPELTPTQRDAIFAAPWNKSAIFTYVHDDRESVALLWKFAPDGRMDVSVGLEPMFRRVNKIPPDA